MASLLTGLHHVTALATNPSENLAFYTEVMSRRLVKKTVNFDDPLTYHLYFADHHASPGTVLTHFPHPYTRTGTHGTPEIDRTVLGVCSGGLGAWRERLDEQSVTTSEDQVADARRLLFDDPHGMRYAIVESAHGTDDAMPILGVEIAVRHDDAIGRFLETSLGFVEEHRDGVCTRWRLDGAHEFVDVLRDPLAPRSVMGAGTVHHVAWRVPDDDTQAAVADRVRAAGVEVTPVMDRLYFRSIYCRIPGAVIFEIATDGPGFTVDEPLESLGNTLMLPPPHEPRRAEIEALLMPI